MRGNRTSVARHMPHIMMIILTHWEFGSNFFFLRPRLTIIVCVCVCNVHCTPNKFFLSRRFVHCSTNGYIISVSLNHVLCGRHIANRRALTHTPMRTMPIIYIFLCSFDVHSCIFALDVRLHESFCQRTVDAHTLYLCTSVHDVASYCYGAWFMNFYRDDDDRL